MYRYSVWCQLVLAIQIGMKAPLNERAFAQLCQNTKGSGVIWQIAESEPDGPCAVTAIQHILTLWKDMSIVLHIYDQVCS